MKNEFKKLGYWDIHSPGKGDNVKEFELLEKYLKAAYDRNPDTVAIEVGSYCGFSTVCIAQYYPVIAIDLWGIDNLEIIETKGDMIGRAETWGIFQENREKYGLRDRVFPTCATSAYLDILPPLNVEVAFIDACHEAPWPYVDAHHCMRHLSDTGVLAFHDAMRYWAGPKYETDMKQEDYIGHGWGGDIIPGDRMQFDPWQGVADGIKQIVAEGEYEVIDKAHGMMIMRKKSRKSIFKQKRK